MPFGLVPPQCGQLGSILSGVAYAFVFMLTPHCVSLVRRKPIPFRNPTLCYVLFMALVSTASFILGIVALALRDDPRNSSATIYQPFRLEILLFPLALWGADGFMMYRCIIIYHGVRPAYKIALFCVLLFLSLLLLGIGLVLPLAIFDILPTYITVGNTFIEWGGNVTDSTMIMFFILASLTTLVNITLSMLVTVRLYLHQRRARKILGSDYGSPYSRIIAICVEACALIVVCDCVFILLFFVNSSVSVAAEYLMVHISVISPLLIISRSARGKDAVSTVRREQTLLKGGLVRRRGLDTLCSRCSRGASADQAASGVLEPTPDDDTVNKLQDVDPPTSVADGSGVTKKEEC